MKIAQKQLLSYVALLIAFSGFLWYGAYTKERIIRSRNVYKVASCLELYAEQNSGRFPDSEQDLIDRGFIRKKENDYQVKFNYQNIYRYLGGMPENSGIDFSTVDKFNEYQIKYRTTPENLTVRFGKLYDVKNDKEVMLIRGPYEGWYYKNIYRELSVDLYKKMMSFKID